MTQPRALTEKAYILAHLIKQLTFNL